MDNLRLKQLYREAMEEKLPPTDRARIRNKAIGALCGAVVLLPVVLYSGYLFFRPDVGPSAFIALLFFIGGILGIMILMLIFSLLVEDLQKEKRLAEIHFDTENPRVLKTILDYVERQVLKPQEDFTVRVEKDLEALKKDLDFYQQDEKILLKPLRTEAQITLLNTEALQRVQAIVKELQDLKATLAKKLKRAHNMVQPIKKDVAAFQVHLSRLTRDKQLIKSRKLVVSIAAKLPIYEDFLVNLATRCEQVRSDLQLLSTETTALAAARAEIRLESVFTPEDEQLLQA